MSLFFKQKGDKTVNTCNTTAKYYRSCVFIKKKSLALINTEGLSLFQGKYNNWV